MFLAPLPYKKFPYRKFVVWYTFIAHVQFHQWRHYVLNDFTNNPLWTRRGGGERALFSPPNESSYFDQILSIGFQDFMSLKIYILADFWENFFPARNFCRPLDPSEVKKTRIFEVFSHSCFLEPNFGEKWKNIFFLENWTKFIKNVTRRIFYKGFLLF